MGQPFSKQLYIHRCLLSKTYVQETKITETVVCLVNYEVKVNCDPPGFDLEEEVPPEKYSLVSRFVSLTTSKRGCTRCYAVKHSFAECHEKHQAEALSFKSFFMKLRESKIRVRG